MDNSNLDEIFKLNAYLRALSQRNKQFATKRMFPIKDEEIKECKDIVIKIKAINEKIKESKDTNKKNQLSRKKGKLLEELANNLLNSTQLFEIEPNFRDYTNEIDLLLRISDYNRSVAPILPKYLTKEILVECKNYDKKIKVDWIGKFFSLLTTHKNKFGIIFSFNELAGTSEWNSSKGLVKKIFLGEKCAIININFHDIEKILNGEINMVELIEIKYDALRNHVDYSKLITKHPAEK